MVPLFALLIPERGNEQKILEVTKNIIDLLTGEVFHPSYPAIEGLNHHNVKVEHTNEEEEECVKVDWTCKEEEIKSESKTDGSTKRNSRERCPRPLYSRDSAQEDLTIPLHHQVYGNPPERCPRPLYSRDPTQEDLIIPHHHQVDD
ncbi:uncharacterized protein ACMZJ9_015600 [Mantella aurantiaca]